VNALIPMRILESKIGGNFFVQISFAPDTLKANRHKKAG